MKLIPVLGLCLFFGSPALAVQPADSQHPSLKRPYKLPPNAMLHYQISARQRGIPLSGESFLSWQVQGHTYQVNNEVRANILGKISESGSHGQIGEYGLTPETFIEKRFRKEPSNTHFDANSKQISFSESAQTYPITGGEQDRTSVIWQLVAQVRSAGKLAVGSEWRYFVAGRRDAEVWIFKVIRNERIDTPLGAINSVHLIKQPPPDSQDQQLDLWLAPEWDWYPAKLRFADNDGDFVEQIIEKIDK